MRSREEQIIDMVDATGKSVMRGRSDYSMELYRKWIDQELVCAETRGRELERVDMGRRIEQLRYRIGGVEIDEMEGDNLAMTLCSAFDGPDDEVGENGWTERATTCCDKIMNLVHAQYVAAMNAENGNG